MTTGNQPTTKGTEMRKATEIREVVVLEVADAEEVRNPARIDLDAEYMGKGSPTVGSYAAVYLVKAGRLYEILPFADLAADLGELMQGDLTEAAEAEFMEVVDEHMSRARSQAEYGVGGDLAENLLRTAAAKRFLDLIEQPGS